MSRNTEKENIEGRMAGLVVIKGRRTEEYRRNIRKKGHKGEQRQEDWKEEQKME
jgi:hypothetical protein